MVDLQGFKEHLNLTGTGNDTELQRNLDAAVGLVEGDCGPLEPQTFTEVVHSGDGKVLLQHWPVVEVTDAALSTGAVSRDTSSDVDHGQHDIGLVDLGATGTWTVTYEAGRGEAYPDLEMAVYLIGEQLWRSQRGQSVRPGIGTSGQPDSSTVPTGFAIPNKAKELMVRHRQLSVR
ncbi:MAG: hypothetical protein ACRDMV_01050 [Streptosporangiales bacterium]